MKLKFAAQLFSEPVANALEFCRDVLQLPEFKNCTATVKFLRTFNELLDILNSCNMRQEKLKKPMAPCNKNLIIEKFEKCTNYIKKLKTVNRIPLIETRRKTGFCFEMIYEKFCEEENLLIYLPAYKLSQDHIELLFPVCDTMVVETIIPLHTSFK